MKRAMVVVFFACQLAVVWGLVDTAPGPAMERFEPAIVVGALLAALVIAAAVVAVRRRAIWRREAVAGLAWLDSLVGVRQPLKPAVELVGRRAEPMGGAGATARPATARPAVAVRPAPADRVEQTAAKIADLETRLAAELHHLDAFLDSFAAEENALHG